MTDKNLRNELLPFFGNDGRAKLFIKIFIEPTNFEQSINEDNPESIVNNSLAMNVMTSEGYETAFKEVGMSNRSLHYEFVDFIVQTALFHKSIDPMTGFGYAKAEFMRQLFEKFTDRGNAGSAFGETKPTDPYKNYHCDSTPDLTQYTGQFGDNLVFLQNLNSIDKFLYYYVGSYYNDRTDALLNRISNFVDSCLFDRKDQYFYKLTTDINTLISNLHLDPKTGNDFWSKFKTEIQKNIAQIASERIKKYTTGLTTPLEFRKAFETNKHDFSDAIAKTLTDTFEKLINDYRPVKAKSTTDDILWNNVYNKWSSLSEQAQKFYKKYVMFMENDKVLNPETDTYNPANKAAYHINLVKKSISDAGQTILAFMRLIPLYSDKIFTGLWYTDKNGKHQFSTSSNTFPSTITLNTDNLLKYIYGSTATNARFVTLNLPDKWTPSPNAIFHINVDDLVRKRLYQLRELLKKEQLPKEPLLGITDKNIWKRDETNKLYRDTPQGPVYYEDNSPASLEMFKSSYKCASSLSKGTEAECGKYMAECILSIDQKQISQCLEFWRNRNFYDIVKEEISNMHPTIAIRILKKFGFREYETYDIECDSYVRKIESRDHWFKDYASKIFTDDVLKIISENDKLLDYLQLITEYINSNLQILNGSQCRKISSEAVGKIQRTELAVQLGIPLRREPKVGSIQGTLYDSAMLDSYFKSGFFNVIARTNPERIANIKNLFIDKIPGTNKKCLNMGAESLQRLIDNTITQLQQQNLQIDPTLRKSLKKKVESLKKLELELMTFEVYLEEFKFLKEMFNDYESEVLDKAQIFELVQKKKELFTKQMTEEDHLKEIFGKLAKALFKMEDVDETECMRPIEY